MENNWNDENNNIKKPPSSYLLFTLDVRSKIIKEFPNKTNKEIAKILGNKWKELTEEEKNPYKKQAEELNLQFKQKNGQYNYKKSKKKRILTQIRGALSENPLLEAQLVSGQFGSDIFQYPVDPQIFLLFTIGNRFFERALRCKSNDIEK